MRLSAPHLFAAGARLHRTGALTERQVRAWGAKLTDRQMSHVLRGYRAEKALAKAGNRAGRPLGRN